jgi:hypothetical protein
LYIAYRFALEHCFEFRSNDFFAPQRPPVPELKYRFKDYSFGKAGGKKLYCHTATID